MHFSAIWNEVRSIILNLGKDSNIADPCRVSNITGSPIPVVVARLASHSFIIV